MKLSIIAILVSISAMSYANDSTWYYLPAIEYDTITNGEIIPIVGSSTIMIDTVPITLDTIPITAQAHLQALPELVKESQALRQQQAALEEAIKNNSKMVMLILSGYADPKTIQGITEDLKNVIIKK